MVSGNAEASVAIRCQCGGRIGPLDSVCPSCRRPKPRIDVGRADTDRRALARGGGFRAIAKSLFFGAAAMVAGYGIFSLQRTALREKEAPVQTEAASPEASPGAAPSDPAVSAPLPPQEWSVRGKIYDLMTLKALSGARITLKDKLSGRSFSCTTDASGEYSVKVPPLSEGGYALSVSVKNRPWAFLEEMEPPYREQDRDRRESALDLLASPSLVHVPIMLTSGQGSQDYDLVVAASR
jgi:hypothetical protein